MKECPTGDRNEVPAPQFLLPLAQGSHADVRFAAVGAEVDGPPQDADERPRTRWFFYGLGLSLQTLLWFLLFLAITVAVLVGGKLTEFRYVGF